MTNATGIGNAAPSCPTRAIAEVFAGGQVPRAATVGGANSTIEPVDGGFMLNGRWPFCSGVPHSEWISPRRARHPRTPAEARRRSTPASSRPAT